MPLQLKVCWLACAGRQGARAMLNVFLWDMNMGVPASDGRRIDVCWRLSQMGFLFSEMFNWRQSCRWTPESSMEQHSFKPIAGTALLSRVVRSPWASAFGGPCCLRGQVVQGHSQVNSTRAGWACATGLPPPSSRRKPPREKMIECF